MIQRGENPDITSVVPGSWILSVLSNIRIENSIFLVILNMVNSKIWLKKGNLLSRTMCLEMMLGTYYDAAFVLLGKVVRWA